MLVVNLSREVRGVPLWRWLVFLAYLGALGSMVAVYLVALSAEPLLVVPLTFVAALGFYGAFVASSGVGVPVRASRDN